MKERKIIARSIAIMGVILLGLLSSLAHAGPIFIAGLSGAQEVPAISTTGTGRFVARIIEDGAGLRYRLEFSDLEGGAVAAAHIHLGQRGVNGGIVIHLCGSGGKAACPTPSGTVAGTLTAADVVDLAAQGIAAGELEAVVEAMRQGLTYVNVHTEAFPAGEIRGQIQNPL